MLVTDSDIDLDHYESDEYELYDESDDEALRSYPDYEDHHYGYKPKKKKKKVYVPVFVPDKEKKKSKLVILYVSFFLCSVPNVQIQRR